jgi:hypothetical protein
MIFYEKGPSAARCGDQGNREELLLEIATACLGSRRDRLLVNCNMTFWKPGTAAPGVLLERETEKETQVFFFFFLCVA